MHWTRVASDEQLGPPRERDQLADRTLHRLGRAFTRGLGRARQILFSRTVVENRMNSARGESAGHAAVAFGRPAFRSPSGSRVQDREGADSSFAQPPIYSALGFDIARKL